MKHKAIWKKEEETLNQFNSPIVSHVTKGNLFGYLDTISPSTTNKSAKYVDTSQYIFICDVVDIQVGDILEINKKVYTVNHVDNPMFINHHLEVELAFVKNI